MSLFTHIPAQKKPGADFALRLEDDALAPCLHRGATAYLVRSVDLSDGEVGLFYAHEGLVFRQYCEDMRGTVYLFSLDRSRAQDDRMFPPGTELPVCYGKVLLAHPPELPMD